MHVRQSAKSVRSQRDWKSSNRCHLDWAKGSAAPSPEPPTTLALQTARAGGGGAQLPATFFEDSTNGAADAAAPTTAPAVPQYISNEAYRVGGSAAATAEPAAGPARPAAVGYSDYSAYADYGGGGDAGQVAAYQQQQFAQQQHAGADARWASVPQTTSVWDVFPV